MTESTLVQIASYATEVEADYVRSLLREDGIPAYVDGAASNTMMSHIGTALGGVRLLTNSGNAEAAVKFLASLEDNSTHSGETWFCGECEETIDAGFQVCWACGKERHVVEGQVSAAASETRADEPNNQDSTQADQVDDIVLRAYRASWIGFILLPIITHAYSMYLLLRVAAQQRNLSPTGDRLWYRAFAITTIGWLTWIAVFIVITRS